MSSLLLIYSPFLTKGMMPTKRLSMRNLQEILRLKLNAKLSMRAIQRVVKVSLGTIQGFIKQPIALELTWENVQLLDETLLTKLFYSSKAPLPETNDELPD